MNRTANARRLRREQTLEEKQLWRALRAGRFAGFKFRRQHPLGPYYLDFYCPAARLSIELDGSQHGSPAGRKHDEIREQFVQSQGIEQMRFQNRHWRNNREGMLLDIWRALHRRTGCVEVMRQVQNHRFIAPRHEQLNISSPLALSSGFARRRGRKHTPAAWDLVHDGASSMTYPTAPLQM